MIEEKDVIEALRTMVHPTAPKLALAVGCSVRGVAPVLRDLVADSYIAVTGTGRRGDPKRYELLPAWDEVMASIMAYQLSERQIRLLRMTS